MTHSSYLTVLFRMSEKHDPLFGGMSTYDLIKMLEIIEMAKGKQPIKASPQEIMAFNDLLEGSMNSKIWMHHHYL